MNNKVQGTTITQRPKFWPVYLFFIIISFITSIFAIYELLLLSSIENLIRYIVIGMLILIDFVLVFKVKGLFKPKVTRRRRGSKHILLLLFMIVYSMICASVGGIIYYVYGEISHLNKVYVTYTSNLITLNGSEATEASDIRNLKIGILEDEKSVEGYIIPMDIVKENKLEDENELISYGDYTSMVVDLYSGDLDACFVSGGYISIFSAIAGYENIQTDTKVIITKSEKLKKTETSAIETASSGKEITEPFTLLLMGIDSIGEDLEKNAVANGDTLILITFNPKTLNATMLSIPRDSYVPIACWANKAENKITHAAAYGNDCMINTIEDYFDVNIDYYAKINFKGLVNLVNALGGVDIDVEQQLCTDDSDRENQVCVYPGYQTLDGEQALVYARNRKQLANGDFGRNYHQQVIVMALMDKIKEIDDVNTFMNIVNTISKSMDTNFTTKQILSFYNVAKDIIKKSLSSDEADLVNIERLYLQGTGQMIYDERARMVLWDYVPNQSSRKDIIRAMKENLELVQHEVIKEFSFSINEPYEKPVIGYGPYNNSSNYSLLPDFTGDSQATATATCTKLGIKCTFKGTGGSVVDQSYPESTRIDNISGSLVLTLSKNDESSTTDKKDSSYIKDKETSKDKSSSKDKDSTKKNIDNDEEENEDDDGNTTSDDDKDVLQESGLIPTPSDDSDEDE